MVFRRSVTAHAISGKMAELDVPSERLTKRETKSKRSPKKNRGICWGTEATMTLIELWTEETIQY